MSSITTPREAARFDEYVSHLAPEAKETILEIAAPSRLSIDVGLAHYGACDKLGLTPARPSPTAATRCEGSCWAS